MGDDNEKDEWREKNMQRKDEGEWMKKKIEAKTKEK